MPSPSPFLSRRILAVVLLTGTPVLASAQSFSLNAGATVTSVVTVARLGDLSFGTTAIAPGSSASVTAANGGRARVDYNEPALVTVPPFVMIAGPGGTLLRVDLACAQATTAASAAPTPFASGCAGGYTPPISGDIGGTHYVYIGGAVSAASSSGALAGSYAGTFSVTATYTAY
jgi:hypothetical protein